MLQLAKRQRANLLFRLGKQPSRQLILTARAYDTVLMLSRIYFCSNSI
jgi:hypothetical protein